MKALPYLEFCQKVRSTTRDQFSYPLIEFYSQPFEPQMVVSLFEPWVQEPMTNPHYVAFRNRKLPIDNWQEELSLTFQIKEEQGLLPAYHTHIQAQHIPANPKKKWAPRKSLHYHVAILPKTLNDFVSDASRAGIELIWKGEITETYFSGKFSTPITIKS